MTSMTEDKQIVTSTPLTKRHKQSIKTSLTHLSGLSSLGSPHSLLKANTVLTLMILYCLSLIFSVIFSSSQGYNFIIFSWKDRDDDQRLEMFQTRVECFFIVVVLLILNKLFFIVAYFINFKQEDLISDISKNVNVKFIIALITLIVSSILGIAIRDQKKRVIADTLIILLSVGLFFSPYRNFKSRKNLHYTSYVSFFVYISLMTSFNIYLGFYGLCNLFNSPPQSKDQYTEQIIFNVVYCTITILVITYFKDVIFATVYLFLMIGYMFNGINSPEFYTTLGLVIFTLLAILHTVYKNKLLAFGFANPDEVNQMLIHHEYHRNNKRQSHDLI